MFGWSIFFPSMTSFFRNAAKSESPKKVIFSPNDFSDIKSTFSGVCKTKLRVESFVPFEGCENYVKGCLHETVVCMYHCMCKMN